jgi:hypothetical protein
MANECKRQRAIRVGLWLPEGSCGVPCVRDVQVTADLSVTEKHFRGTLWSYLGIGQDEGHIFKQPCGCDTVARLDDMVQRGLVARARAAALCNVLAISDSWCYGMLWRLVQEHRYAFGCRCVQKLPYVLNITATPPARNQSALAVKLSN